MTSLAAALVFVWLGMVVAISFMEAPLKFRAPGVTVQIGVGIGRIVFGALNKVEMGLSLLIVMALILARDQTTLTTTVIALLLLTLLGAQLVVIRPRLRARSEVVLTGGEAPRSKPHLWYIGAETAKVLTLVALGAHLLQISG